MLSRFWYFLVAALAGAGIAAAFMAQDQINRTAAAAVEEGLRRDRAEIELWLRYDARLRIDDIAPMAAHSDVRNALKQATARRDRSTLDDAIRTPLGTRLAELNQQLREGAAQLLFAVDGEGEIVAQLGGEAPPAGAGLAAFPLVQRALRGYVGDDVWVYNGKVYRMAARPVIDGGQYVGAVVHGSEVSAALAQRLATRIPGATLAFFLRDSLVATHVPASEGAVQQNVLQEGLAAALGDAAVTTAMASGPAEARDLPSGRFTLAFVRGSAAHAQVGYAIARGHVPMASPTDLFRSQESLDAVPWPIVIGAPVLLGLLGLLFVFLELARPLKAFRTAAQAIGSGHSQRVDEAAMRGAFRQIAADVNSALERAQAAGGVKKPAKDLDEILGPKDSGGAPKGGGYFGFSQDEPGADAIPEPPRAAPKPPVAAPPAAPPAAPAAPKAAPPPPAPPGPPAAPKAAPPPPAPARPEPMPEPEPRSLSTGLDDDEEDGATMVAHVPKELLAAAAEANEDEAHFKEVFEQFVALKTECGEPTAGLTLDKFKQTLRKNREAIVSKHGAKTVRFTVYKKDGKAALKATPVKD